MINGNVKEFVDNLYYGSEMYFIFHDKRYFIQGWIENSVHYLVLDYSYEGIDLPKNYAFEGYIWEHKSTESGECVQAFLDAPIWNGKTFYEVEKEMTWIDP
ncbi:MAG: hypothetical protein K6G10_06255 [Butyrivibrio sp.]|nr:hypothetical protein [Butyrivibrio sp.]